MSLVAPSLRRRMACWLYEALLLFALALIAALLFSALVDMRSGIDPRRWLLQAYLAVVGGIYFGFFWSRGQTLAMKTWRIAIVDRQGRRLTEGRALLRYVACVVWVLPPLLAAEFGRLTRWEIAAVFLGWVASWAALSRLHPQRQFWHDAFAGTRLVQAPARGPLPGPEKMAA